MANFEGEWGFVMKRRVLQGMDDRPSKLKYPRKSLKSRDVYETLTVLWDEENAFVQVNGL